MQQVSISHIFCSCVLSKILFLFFSLGLIEIIQEVSLQNENLRVNLCMNTLCKLQAAKNFTFVCAV